MEDWVKRILEEEKRKRNAPLEVKRSGRNYYLYISTTIWDKREKKRKKVSRYLGRITENGVVERCRANRSVRSIYEYGNAKILIELLNELVSPLKKAFPDYYKDIIAMSIVKVIRPTPLKLIKSVWEKLYLSQEIETSLSPNILSEKLRLIGSDWNAQKDFFEHLLSNSKYLVFDLSSIFSYSQNLQLAEKGHNAEHFYLNQVNFALLFSQDKHLPVLLKTMPGSIKDIKAFRHLLKELELQSAIVVLDRGFASYKLPHILKEEFLSFVLPLKRNFQIIDYNLRLSNSFLYRDRGINWGRKKAGRYFLYVFEDVKLRGEEETNFIKMIENGKRKRAKLEKEKTKFGKIAILSNLDDSGKRIYLIYKTREEVEIAFDAMKNEMENDKTYLSDDDAVRGYFFISFISLYLYFRLLNLLRQKELLEKISVNELLFELSKVYLVHYSDGTKRLCEIPAKVEKLEKTLDLKLFPKELRS